MNILLDYIIWWYSQGLVVFFKYLKSFFVILSDTFSVRIITTTFFKPWKKDATPTSGLSIDQKLRVIIFNLISVGFGMFIKTAVFIAFLATLLILFIIAILMTLAWIFAPLIIIEFFTFGILFLLK